MTQVFIYPAGFVRGLSCVRYANGCYNLSAMSTALTPQVVEPQELTDLSAYQFEGDNATVENKRRFIQAFRSEGSVYHAAAAIGIHRGTVYRWLERDIAFAEALEDSKEDCYDQAETSVFKKALNGDSLLLMFYLKAHRPKFRDKVTIDIEAVNQEIKERMGQMNVKQLPSVLPDNLPSATPNSTPNITQFLPAPDDQQKGDGDK